MRLLLPRLMFFALLVLAATASTTGRLPYNFFLDVDLGDYGCRLVRAAENSTAVDQYFVALEAGYLGQAIRERYAFDGQIGTGGIVGHTGLSIDELVVQDLKELLQDEGDLERIFETRKLLKGGLTSREDPGLELVKTLVMILDADQVVKREL